MFPVKMGIENYLCTISVRWHRPTKW